MNRCPALLLALALVLTPGCYSAFVALEPTDGGTDATPDAAIEPPPDAGPDASVQPLPEYELCRVLGLGTPHDVAISSDGSRVAIAASHEAVRVVTAADPNVELHHLLGHPIDGAFRVRWLSNGSLLTVASDGWRIFAADGALETFVPDVGARDVDEVPGGLVVLRGGALVYVTRDGTEVRRASTGSFQGHALHVSPDRARLLVAGRTGMRVYSIDGLEERGWVLGNVDRPAAAWSPDSRWIALAQASGAADRPTLAVYDALGHDLVGAVGGTQVVHGIAWSDDARWIVAARTGGEDVYRVEPPPGAGTVPESVALESTFFANREMRAIAARGGRAIVLGDEGLVSTLSIGTSVTSGGDLILALEPLHGVGVATGSIVATGDGFWRGGSPILDRRPTRSAVAVTADGSTIAASDGGTIEIGPLSGPPTATFTAGYVTLLAFSPDGRSLAALADPIFDATVIFFDLETAREIGRYPLGSGITVTALAVSDGATHFALGLGADRGGGVEVRRRDGFLVLDANEGTASTPAAVTFSPDGAEFALALGGQVRVVALDGSRDRTLAGGPGAVGVAYSGDGTTMIESSSARAVVRDAATGEILAELGPHAPTAAGRVPAASHDASEIVLAGDGVAHVHCRLP